MFSYHVTEPRYKLNVTCVVGLRELEFEETSTEVQNIEVFRLCWALKIINKQGPLPFFL